MEFVIFAGFMLFLFFESDFGQLLAALALLAFLNWLLRWLD